MTRRHLAAGACLAALLALAAGQRPVHSQSDPLTADLDAIFDDPLLARAVMGVRVDSLVTGATLYTRNAGSHVVPASNMKIVTMAVAAARLGWDYQYETRLEAIGTLDDGTLTGDLVVRGSGDPTIGSPDGGLSPVFTAWADALVAAGVRRVDGRLVGDDNAFDDERLGAGWAWDYVADGYAAPVGALNFNENVVVLRVAPGRAAGDAVTVTALPAGHGLEVIVDARTGAAGSNASISLFRFPGDNRLHVRGSVPAGGATVTRTAAVDNPTRFFVDALRLALASRGITVRDGAWDIDDLAAPIAGETTVPHRAIAMRRSLPFSAIGGYFMKVSQNVYGEAILKTAGRAAGRTGSAESGRQAVRESLADWGVAADEVVMYDGSGLSRYNYVTPDAIVTILRRMWADERLRGPFVAALPVGGHDGTLSSRMRESELNRRVQAKTGTIANVRSLSGYLETRSGERLVFSMIANHFTAPSARIDAIVERALARLVER